MIRGDQETLDRAMPVRRQVVESLGVPLAIGVKTSRVFDRAAEAGFGENDRTAIVCPLESPTGIEVK